MIGFAKIDLVHKSQRSSVAQLAERQTGERMVVCICVVPLSKTLYLLLSTVPIQEDRKCCYMTKYC